VPRRDGLPLVLDMALTPVALGKLLRAQAEGQPIPEAWGFLDREGRPTTDPAAALRGVIPAIGGYKGTGLSIMMNVLAGVLPGGHHTKDVDVGKRGQFFLVLSPSLLGDEQTFLDDVERMCEQIKSSELLPGVDEVFLPGEPEERRRQQRLERGTIPYPRSVVEALHELASMVGAGLVTASRLEGGVR
jgi:LDH2 family malate/lactate/ureidoglycolate dehydrogenase